MSSLVGLTFWVDILVKLEIKASNSRIMFHPCHMAGKGSTPVQGVGVASTFRMMFPDLPKGFRDDLPEKKSLKNQVPGP